MNNVLIVYFTRTGNSKKIAEQISIKLNCEVDEIIDQKKWKGIRGFLKGGLNSICEKTTKISYVKNPKDYDILIIVSPVWATKVPPAIRTYIVENINSMKKYALIINNNGGNIKKAFNNFKKILSKPITEYGTCSKDIDTDACQKCFEEFSDAIRRTLEKEKHNA